MYLDPSLSLTAPVVDCETGETVARVDVYGLPLRSVLWIANDGTSGARPFEKAVERLGLDPTRFVVSPFAIRERR